MAFLDGNDCVMLEKVVSRERKDDNALATGKKK